MQIFLLSGKIQTFPHPPDRIPVTSVRKIETFTDSAEKICRMGDSVAGEISGGSRLRDGDFRNAAEITVRIRSFRFKFKILHMVQ